MPGQSLKRIQAITSKMKICCFFDGTAFTHVVYCILAPILL